MVLGLPVMVLAMVYRPFPPHAVVVVVVIPSGEVVETGLPHASEIMVVVLA